MTRVEPWVQRITEEVLGGPPVAVGRYYVHPTDGLVKVISGQYWGTHGLSNFWYWEVVATGKMAHGYGGEWPEVQRCEERVRSPRGAYHCVLPAGHHDDPLSLHQINLYGEVETGEGAT